jgi:hypothetical protein
MLPYAGSLAQRWKQSPKGACVPALWQLGCPPRACGGQMTGLCISVRRESNDRGASTSYRIQIHGRAFAKRL